MPEEGERGERVSGLLCGDNKAGCVKLTSRTAGVSPSRDQASGSGAGTAGGQGHNSDVAVQGGGLAQLDQHDVVVQVVAAVAGVADDLGGVDELLGALADGNVVLTKTHLDATVGPRQER